MELAMATSRGGSFFVTGLRCRTSAAAPAFSSTGTKAAAPAAADRRSWRRATTPATASGRGATLTVSAACKTCKGKGAVECPGCKGTGKNKKNGNIFERWKCFDCQGFGLKSCPSCGKGGLTPEQRGER